MKRKLIKQGHDTLTVTLPKEWISKQNLNKGSEIAIDEYDGKLILSSDGKKDDKKKITIDATNLTNPLIWRYFMAAYRTGFDEIKFTFKDPKKLYEIIMSSTRSLEKKTNYNKKSARLSIIEILQDMVHRFIGMEIIEQKDDYCIIKDVSETAEKEFDNSIRRIFILLLGMAEDNLELIEKKDERIRSNIDISDINIDRFTDYCLRILNKNGKKRNATAFYSTILLLEFIGDEYRKIAYHEPDLKRKNKLLIELSAKTKELFDLFYNFFYNFSEEKAIKIHEEERKLHEELFKSDFKLEKEEMDVTFHLKKIKRFIIDLVALRMEQEVSKSLNSLEVKN
jgi:phosphate uptake regulator